MRKRLLYDFGRYVLLGQGGNIGALLALALTLAKQADDGAETEAGGHQFYREGDEGEQDQHARGQDADGELGPVVAGALEGLAPEKRAENEAEEDGRCDESRDVHEQHHERRAHTDAGDHQDDRGDRHNDQHRKADAEGGGVLAEVRAGVFAVLLLPQRREPQEEIGDKQQADVGEQEVLEFGDDGVLFTGRLGGSAAYRLRAVRRARARRRWYRAQPRQAAPSGR